jgi:hypothetical protein
MMLANPTPARDRPLFGVIGHVAGVFVEHPGNGAEVF